MINWKFLLVASVACTSLFAETTKIMMLKDSGKAILKDKDNKDLEIKEDSKLTITIKPSDAVEKSVLQNGFQIKINSDQQEVQLDAVQVYETGRPGKTVSPTAIYYQSKKEATKQDLNVDCFSVIDVKEKDLKYIAGSVDCVSVKASGCKGYTLGTKKQFTMGDANICVGKKEASISEKDATYEETITCKIFDDFTSAKSGGMITYTRDIPNLKEKHVKSTTGDCK